MGGMLLRSTSLPRDGSKALNANGLSGRIREQARHHRKPPANMRAFTDRGQFHESTTRDQTGNYTRCLRPTLSEAQFGAYMAVVPSKLLSAPAVTGIAPSLDRRPAYNCMISSAQRPSRSRFAMIFIAGSMCLKNSLYPAQR